MAKRSCMVGIKITEDTRDKIEYLAGKECRPISSYINLILLNHLSKIEAFENDTWRYELEEVRKSKGN